MAYFYLNLWYNLFDNSEQDRQRVRENVKSDYGFNFKNQLFNDSEFPIEITTIELNMVINWKFKNRLDRTWMGTSA